ncbi:unconventional myosin-Ie-like isoform X2 [Homarus americanus]|uniref:unconventional myosin-Ie-like isoform X2 n=1 Tax=Homarus americanus TaxID=6706 RepID=UPI001C45BBF7|nr:unconventional myosin-Ie-like isoform X2 [Homarus americanus]
MKDSNTYHWQSEAGAKKSSVDDMVLLTKITEDAITDNLKRRFLEDKIYTYIGPVLVAVNPFKQLPYFGEREIEMYQGAAQYEVPPHIYSLADNMYRNMLIDSDSQCVIISGESGAGKTVSAKFIMNYITRVSGGGQKVQQVKEIILESNPLLESFGNAKTTRNNNSSRFGKYVEIQFSRGGEPLGGKISNFLLEKSRVHSLNEGERSFHIFYQICAGATPEMKSDLGVVSPEYFKYLNQSGVYKVDGTNDAHEFQETLRAMSVMGITEGIQMDILRIVAAILHMSNVSFMEQNNAAFITDPNFLEFPAYLLGIDSQVLGQKLVSRVFDSKWGGKSERVDVTLNTEQAQFTRDAWTKGLYSRLFDYIVETVNGAMVTDANLMCMGILDIYGFEIFAKNGFEQFCINYVNEKLQQIFIELTLKSEQEEYHSEGIQWSPIKFFDNKVVCDLIETKRPPGIMCILDDTCATMSAKSEGADEDFHRKMESQVGTNPYYQKFNNGFTIKHYAGNVSYHIDNFCEKNRDVLFVDIIEVMQKSSNAFIRSLFPDVIQSGAKGRPTTAGTKIRTQANELVTTLMKCMPHYIRCIKPNETKKPHDWDDQMVKHQVGYLGLKENIRVKRAGFAYRRPYHKFLQRYAILTRETWPSWHGDLVQGIHHIMQSVNMDPSQYQIGRSKIFVKDPESLYMLEESRERKYDHHARIIQMAFKKFFSKQRYLKEREEASDLLVNRKERCRYSLNRNFHGDYIGVEYKPGICALIPRREKVEFALTVDKFDRKFRKTKRDLIVTKSNLYLIGRVQVKKGPDKCKFIDVIKRKIELENIVQATLSTYQDDLVLIHVRNDYESLLEVKLKTEFLMVLNRKLKERHNRELPLNFINSFDFRVRKTGWGGGGVRKVMFSAGPTEEPHFTVAGSTLTVRIAQGLPSSSRPGLHRDITPDIRILANTMRAPAHNSSNRNFNKHGPTKPSYRPPDPASLPPRPANLPPSPANLPPSPPSLDRHSPNSSKFITRPSGPAPGIPGTRGPPIGGRGFPVIPGGGRGSPIGMGGGRGPRMGTGSIRGPRPVGRGGGRGPSNLPVNNPPFRLPVLSPPIPNMQPPPPPSDPPPANQPTIGTGNKLYPSRGGANLQQVSMPKKPPIEKPKPKIPQVRALYNYDASDTDELTFVEGDILQLVHEDASGWSTCKLRGREGFCPANYLEKI